MSTLMTSMEDLEDWVNPNVVKVVTDQKNFALYFSRSPIPFPRGLHFERLLRNPAERGKLQLKKVFKHIGVYVYRRQFLLRYSRMRPTPLEEIEKLEQLRALECGYRIKVVLVNYTSLHVDTPEDLSRIVAFLSAAE